MLDSLFVTLWADTTCPTSDRVVIKSPQIDVLVFLPSRNLSYAAGGFGASAAQPVRSPIRVGTGVPHVVEIVMYEAHELPAAVALRPVFF
jgi:hypothetical protein